MFKAFYQDLSQILFDDFVPLSNEAKERKKAEGRHKALEILINYLLGNNELKLKIKVNS
jgi:hypothetical protein